jgi:pimeloyl-ACP methyl ester carboxylesterase
VNGLAVHESGPIGAPALVFLHGVGTDASMWAREIALLSDCHCLAPDLPGHGRSVDLSWTSLADVADQVADVIAAKTADGRACVVGLSLGGAVGYVLLARSPDVVSRAVIDGAAIVPSRLTPLMTTGVRLASPFLHRAVVIRALGQAVGVPPVDMPSFEKGIRGVRPRAFRRAFAQAQNPGVLHDVLPCKVPTLLVTGQHEMGDMHAANAALAAYMPQARARVAPGLGHGWIATRPDLHSRMVRAWLQDQPLPNELQPERADWHQTRAGRRIAASAAELGLSRPTI